MQGQAAPRSFRVYDDCALVLGMARPGAWIASRTVDACIDEVVQLLDGDAVRLRDIGADPARGASPRAGAAASHPFPPTHATRGLVALFPGPNAARQAYGLRHGAAARVG